MTEEIERQQDDGDDDDDDDDDWTRGEGDNEVLRAPSTALSLCLSVSLSG